MRVEIVTDKEKQAARELSERILNELEIKYATLDETLKYLVVYLTSDEFELLQKSGYSCLYIHVYENPHVTFHPKSDMSYPIDVPVVISDRNPTFTENS